MPPGASILSAGLGFIAGTAWQLRQPQLWPLAWSALALVAALLLVAAGRGGRFRWPAPSLLVLAAGAALFGFALASMRAEWRLQDTLAAEIEGRDLLLVGVVDGLPDASPQRWRFAFEVESARLPDGGELRVPRRVLLGWYANPGSPPLPALRAGERWQLPVRLKRPHGLVNPHGFDYELWLFEQRLRATGYVRDDKLPAPVRLGFAQGHRIDRARQWVREAIFAQVGHDEAGAKAASVLAALAVGDQGAIDREDWALYRDTGVAHLMSISGVHVTMFAWLAGLLVGRLWRLSTRAMHWLPAPQAARWGGLLCALLYALLAGFGVPAQRTLLMLATAVLLRSAGLVWRWPAVMGVAAVAVTLLDPWALLQPGFWLSFGAVALLLAAGDERGARDQAAVPLPASRPRRLWRAAHGGVRAQWIATIGLAPLSLLCFQQVSLVGFGANLLAIPLVTLLITPLALLGVLVPLLWWPAAWAVQGLNAGLAWMLAASGGAAWTAAAAPVWAGVAALVGALLFVLPLPRRWRLLGLPLAVPLLWPALAGVAPGSLTVLAADIGQGSAVLLRTAHHALLFDAGPQYSREADAGERVLRPLLRAQGVAALDMLVLSHRDIDHVGGAATLLKSLPVARLQSSLEPGHPLLALARERGAAVEPCLAGARWDWDGVGFEWLHPDAELLAAAHAPTPAAARIKPNALSCVLRVHAAGGAPTLLLAGDMERAQEVAVLERSAAGALRSEILVLAHHGSVTSSSPAWLEAVAPRVALVQAGYRNRFGHPAPPVMQRLRERHIEVVESARCGAWTLDAAGARCERAARRRYWQHDGWQQALAGTPPAPGGLDVANLDPSAARSAPEPEDE
ncbi:DNA internalization-related competence protein ComEC/Rec2 [Rivibacter subsaxonicus]|uniref:Competence protein ComEC n=1 Tax=Rivibacter subsaxonicus TaxID=457575 RepID=A0A4Q7VNM6_9BURK|nr:DNA internalization-related competence protein ComEC/Rec2 [Rivibacter subsaxonicus]RZT97922.1 competence protein ComEC [Rivibacter subsaxonicus]